MTATNGWWITTDALPRGGEKILGPFATQELALEVRRFVEIAKAPQTFWVDRDEAAGETPWAELRETVKAERDLLAKMAAEHQSVFFNAKSDAYGWVLATMDRMEAGQ